MNVPNKKRILLADNSTEYRHLVLGFLELEGYDVTEVASPEEAQKKLERGEFDLVLADLRMRDDEDANDVSGMEIAKFASESGIPCIIVTAFPTVERARMALRSHRTEPFVKDLIPKASSPQALLDSIRSALSGDPTTNAPPPPRKKKDK
jgi:DNA-binding NtrC family response regulator